MDKSKNQPKRINITETKDYYKLYHRNYYHNNHERLKRYRNLLNFKKVYPYIPMECFDDFKKDKVAYLKLIKKKLNKKVILGILNEFYSD